ncbi:MAG TPA: leucyl aminopeptidase [Acidobacteriaceae bacterium]|jgi:leucyl aminopeptidase|nr:leucyl aminopeptidase [Acidobacteriaceae bacterium]
MKGHLSFTSPAAVETGLLAVFAVDASTSKAKDAQAEIRLLAEDPALTGATATVLASGEFKAEPNETLLLHAPAGLKAKRILLVGLGKAAKLTPHEVRKGAGVAVRFARPRGLRELAIAVPAADSLDPKLTARAVAEGALLADFDSDTYRSDRKDRSLESLQFVVPTGADRAAAEAGQREGEILAEAQNFTRSLVNEPGNRLTPTIFGERAAAMCREAGLECSVYGADKLRELQMGAFLSVTQGSEEPPALIVMTYEPKNAKAGTVLGLVGKGITFDSGGISIKPSDSMEKMKYDMAGGAAMIGAMRAIAQLQPAVKVIGIVCASENMPSGKAQKPGDVQIAMPAPGKPGKAIEIINTDAEGRLVLADGVTYAKQLGATHLIDAATLTGAVGIALGMINGGVFSNDEETYQRFADGLKISGERFWRLPVEDDYRELIRSSIGDIKNTGGRYGGAITAAMFIKEFVEDTPWIHLDIAGVAWVDDAKPWQASGPTGAAVRSIVEWVRSYGV